MLVVDSNKRIKLSGIRQNSWFQKDLPAYLQPLPVRPPPSDESEVEGASDEEEEEEGPDKWVEGIGLVEQTVVDDLCSKIAGLSSDDVWQSLRTGADKELLIAYQLCRDNRQLQGARASPFCLSLGPC
jgi:carbon catabolite-derepressing protein kinase